ncbi:MAG: hypothetical protein JWO27_2592 [Frankiales bacterium]|jgi:uncharacterized membrane protein|nr:hypothetical protein [Frankiales bacterium]MCW2708372.1 hypothetical protein [Frankiales bacterium]
MTEPQRLQPHTRSEKAVWASVRKVQDHVTDAITSFAGSLSFVYIHVVWFGAWVLLNVGVFGLTPFDKFPFGLLTLIVSLEAIFLSTFVMISQNRAAARADVRSELDFETNLRSEVWSVHIGRTLGLDPHEVEGHVQKLIAQARTGLTDGSAGDVDPAVES